MTQPIPNAAPSPAPPMDAARRIPAERQGIGFILRVRRDPLGYFTRLMRETGPFAWMKLGPTPLLMLNDATAIQHVLQDNFAGYRKGSFNKVLLPLLGEGIFLSEGPVWQKQRRDTAPVFAAGNFNDMTAQMVAATEAMLKRWEPIVARGEPIDINHETMALTLDIVLRALFHEAKDGIAAGVQDALGILLEEAERRIWAIASLPQRLVLAMPKYRRAMKFLDRVVEELVEARRANAGYPEDLLSRLLDQSGGEAKTARRLRDQVLSFLLAGHETTANALAWAFYELGRHPQIHQTMKAEIDGVLGAQTPTIELVRGLAYTRQVFDEALRLYPPVWTMSREALGDDEIPFDDGSRIAIAKGTAVMLCAYALHRRDSYWPEPESFAPDRQAADKTAARAKFAAIPFGGGPRLCLGMRFAQVESVIALAMITQRYDMTLLPGQKLTPKPIITLRPDGPILFRARPRACPAQPAAGTAKSVADNSAPPAPACPYAGSQGQSRI